MWIGAQEAIDEATAGKRTLVHATTKNLELLAEGVTVTGALAPASGARSSPVQPWVETRDGKRYLTFRRRGIPNPELPGAAKSRPSRQPVRRPDGPAVMRRISVCAPAMTEVPTGR